MEWVVAPSEGGQKLVHFIKQKLGSTYSSRQIKSGIESNLCRVNHRLEHFASVAVAAGDHVSFEIEILGRQSKTAFTFAKSDIVYENHELLIYNKPSGYASDSVEIQKSFPEWDLLHRLDRETSGLLMFTKGAEFRKSMVNAFKMHAIEKVYLAIVDGIPRQSSGIIENYLGKLHEYEGQTIWGSVPARKGLLAITHWELQQKGKEASLLRCYPKTGRTHQIRVHLSEMGHPILGDKQYGRSIHSSYPATRCLLHAYELSFIHPTSQQKMRFQARLPEDFKLATEHLIGNKP